MAVTAELRVETSVSDEDRRQIHTLFPAQWAVTKLQRPAFRILLMDAHDEIVGHAAVAEATDGLPRGLGVGTVVVAENLRGNGLGRTLLTEVDRACVATGAEFVFAASRHPAVRRVLRDLGYRTPPYGSLYFADGDYWCWNESWLVRGELDERRPTRLRWDY